MCRYTTFLLLCAMATPLRAQTNMPANSQIQQRLFDYVDVKHGAPGIVVGVVDSKGSRVFACGKRRADGPETVDGDTLFEIGSATKVFTCIVLEDMAGRGEVSSDDPIKKFLPASVKTPSRNGREITLLDLATHRSGLPRIPDNMSPMHLLVHLHNPYADYSADKLYDFLSHYTLPRDPGAEYEYSNLGVGLLGHLLSLKAGTNYEALVVNRICRPLQMTNTVITLSPELKSRFATGHSASGKPVSNWDFQALAGCGALRSTVNDLLKFLAANMALTPSPLAETFTRAHAPRRDADRGLKVALGWHINPDGGVWHNGGTGGYHSFIGFNPRTHRGIVVLANSANSIDALALSLLAPRKNP
jgi:serine-type D-Ala-D-Ala carboxypeptidase/endopeptidase